MHTGHSSFSERCSCYYPHSYKHASFCLGHKEELKLGIITKLSNLLSTCAGVQAMSTKQFPLNAIYSLNRRRNWKRRWRTLQFSFHCLSKSISSEIHWKLSQLYTSVMLETSCTSILRLYKFFSTLRVQHKLKYSSSTSGLLAASKSLQSDFWGQFAQFVGMHAVKGLKIMNWWFDSFWLLCTAAFTILDWLRLTYKT